MKKIVLACGSGVATSTAVAKKVSPRPAERQRLRGSVRDCPVRHFRGCCQLRGCRHAGRHHRRPRRYHLRLCERRSLPDRYGQGRRREADSRPYGPVGQEAHLAATFRSALCATALACMDACGRFVFFACARGARRPMGERYEREPCRAV